MKLPGLTLAQTLVLGTLIALVMAPAVLMHGASGPQSEGGLLLGGGLALGCYLLARTGRALWRTGIERAARQSEELERARRQPRRRLPPPPPSTRERQ